MQPRRARITRPYLAASSMQSLRWSRYRAGRSSWSVLNHRYYLPLHPRPRSIHRSSASTLRYLVRRRNLARKAQALGFCHVGKGFWYDPAADASYVQLGNGFSDVSEFISVAGDDDQSLTDEGDTHFCLTCQESVVVGFDTPCAVPNCPYDVDPPGDEQAGDEQAGRPVLIYPIDRSPDAIRELGVQCSGCGLVHDVSDCRSIDRVYCPCGFYLKVS